MSFVHRYEPPRSAGRDPTLLLLHGTGGSETDLLPLGRALAPEAGLLSPRGQVLEGTMPRFFRRLAEGVFDLEDLVRRTHELAAFVEAAAVEHAFDPHRVIAVGLSNGANIAASLLLLRPGLLEGAVLFRAMVPLVPDTRPALAGTPVLLSSGARDPIVPRAEAERLASLLREHGAEVTLAWQDAGHELTGADLAQGRAFLGAIRSGSRG